MSAEPITDELLTAYVDGELPAEERSRVNQALATDPAVKSRFDKLAGTPSLKEPFATLLDAAPGDRLAAILKEAEAKVAPPARAGILSALRPRAAIAAAILLFLAGGAVGIGLQSAVLRGTGNGSEEKENWRTAVADYLSLYTSETLASIPDDPGQRAREVADAGTRLALPLDVGKVVLPDLDLKRAQIFAFRDKPLVQIAYLSQGAGPVAFCIIRNGQKDAAPAFEEREGKGIVCCGKDGRGFMLIGSLPREQL
ncbi:MAG: zf-HC2 domain-containing protein [Rhizobiales bacterium]|nr:zf-HC2 domain-containing protein [Hyphomicrobiales bacterium]